jgi:hypothetical protein
LAGKPLTYFPESFWKQVLYSQKLSRDDLETSKQAMPAKEEGQRQAAKV